MKKLFLTLTLVLAAASVGFAALTPMDSASFDWKYEMTVIPDTQDLDSDTKMDFYPYSDGTITASGGILTIASPGIATAKYTMLRSDATGSLWPDHSATEFTYANGYTIEARVKIIASEGGGPLHLLASPSGTTAHADWAVSSTGSSWAGVAVGTNDNTDDFHIFRVAQVPGQTAYGVWRDGVLLQTITTSAVDYDAARLRFGDTAGSDGGTVEVDYIRFTSGAYAPIPEPATMGLLAVGGLGVLVRRKRK